MNTILFRNQQIVKKIVAMLINVLLCSLVICLIILIYKEDIILDPFRATVILSIIFLGIIDAILPSLILATNYCYDNSSVRVYYKIIIFKAKIAIPYDKLVVYRREQNSKETKLVLELSHKENHLWHLFFGAFTTKGFSKDDIAQMDNIIHHHKEITLQDKRNRFYNH